MLALRSSDVGPSDAQRCVALLRALPLLSHQPLGFGHVDTTELGLPLINAGIVDTVFAAKLRDRRAPQAPSVRRQSVRLADQAGWDRKLQAEIIERCTQPIPRAG